MVVPAIVAVDDQGHALRVNSVEVNVTERTACPPEPNQISRRHHQDLIGDPKDNLVDGVIRRQWTGTCIDDDVAITRPEFEEELLKKASGNAPTHRVNASK